MVCGIAPMTAVTVYSVAGLSRPGRPPRCSACWPTGRRQAGAGRRAAGAGAVRRRLSRRSASSASSMRSSVVFGLAYGGVMPLYAILVREYFGAAHHGHGVRRGLGARQPRHGARPVGRRLGVRHLRQLLLALYRLVRHRPRRGRGGAEFPFAEAATAILRSASGARRPDRR